MKLLIASDIHGNYESTKFMLKVFRENNCDKILLLGDILYFGPRNQLTEEYNPKCVIELLNDNSDKILAVRGNCDSEVDQMVLNFPILADYCYIMLDGISVFATHGHHFNTDNPPPLRPDEILLHGHTHMHKCVEFGNGNYYLNPGSLAFPKEGNAKTYMIYENRCFTVYDFEANIIYSKQF